MREGPSHLRYYRPLFYKKAVTPLAKHPDRCGWLCGRTIRLHRSRDAPQCSPLNLLNKKPPILRMMEVNVQADGFIHVLIISGMRLFPYRKIAHSILVFDHLGFPAAAQLGEMGQRFAHGEAELVDAELLAEEGGADLEGG